jgi:VIT1/CCC1 family predicted Fe2+/Mn2+ transporter
LLFSIGAIVPVLPFFVFDGTSALVASLILSGLALFGLGALITVFTGRSAWATGLRQLLLGGAAAALTHLLGRVIGASL